MAFGDVHVRYLIERDQWVVKVEGSNVSSLHQSKWEAVSAGRARASATGVDLLIHARAPIEEHERVAGGPAA